MLSSVAVTVLTIGAVSALLQFPLDLPAVLVIGSVVEELATV